MLAVACVIVAIVLVVLVGYSVTHGIPSSTTGSTGKGPPVPPHATTKPTADPATFQAGICYKSHSGTVNYGPDDQAWQANLPALKAQTKAGWIQMVVILYQDTHDSTTLYAGANSTTPANLAQGIAQAHAAGLKVFLVPYINVLDGNATRITFTDPGDAAAWFNGYWSAFKPYFEVAQQQKVEMVAIASETAKMEGDQYANDWGQLISRIRSVYPTGPLTYNLITESWTSKAVHGVVGWMKNPALTYLGVQEYTGLAQQPQPEPESVIALQWQEQVLPRIDAFAAASGKPLIISEIGYRNSADALYQPAYSASSAPQDPALQAAAYQAALDAALSDPNLHGIYFFAWDEGVFTPSPAALSVLQTVYATLHG